MKYKDLFQETFSALLSNKVRSSLTVLGIVIGIASVIAMLAVGNGASSSIQSSIQSIGSNLLVISPGAQKGVGTQVSTGRGASQTLKPSDADAITAQISTVTAVAPELTGRHQVVAKGTNTNTSIVGTVPAYLQVRNFQMDIGSFFTDADVTSGNKVAVLGPTTRDDLFGAGVDPTGQIIRINNLDFTVIGVTVAKGGSGFSNPDDAVYIPITAAEHYIVGAGQDGSYYVSQISVEVDSSTDMQTTQDAITTLLLSLHHISDPTQADFSILNQADILSTASSVTQTFTILLASVAGISLVVGGIGIMNMMLTTVTERTREIGLRKAIGAKEKDINAQFLAEAILLTFFGGTVGIILGVLISYIVMWTGVEKTDITISSVLLAFGVSALIGIVFGYYPARRASKLNPIEALRYE